MTNSVFSAVAYVHLTYSVPIVTTGLTLWLFMLKTSFFVIANVLL